MNKPPVKVMHVIPGLGVGGAESMLTALVTSGRSRAPLPVVVDVMRGGVNGERIREHGVGLYDLGVTRARQGPLAIARLARLIRREAPDVIQSWMYYGDLVATLGLWRSGRRRRTRLYWGVRCSDMETRHYGPTLRLAIAACIRLSSVPDAVIANSETGRRVHLDLGYRTRRFEVIPNGIDIARFRPDPDARRMSREEFGLGARDTVVILPARVDPMKDHDNFLAALDRLPGLTAIAVGKGTEALPKRPNLIALGARFDMPALYAAADLMVLGSAFGEGFSNVLGEAMACGLPAVVTDVGDSARIIADAGTVVPPRDPAALAEAIRGHFDRTTDTRRAMARAARARITKNFSLERAVRAFENIYRNEAVSRTT